MANSLNEQPGLDAARKHVHVTACAVLMLAGFVDNSPLLVAVRMSLLFSQ